MANSLHHILFLVAEWLFEYCVRARLYMSSNGETYSMNAQCLPNLMLCWVVHVCIYTSRSLGLGRKALSVPTSYKDSYAEAATHRSAYA